MAKLIIDKLFDTNKKFQREDFLEFVSEITGKYPNNTKKSQDKDGLYLRELLDIYEDKSGEKISIMIYKMPSSAKVEKARSYQRNLISNYLKNEGVFEGIDSVLCAFYSEDTSDWRLSFVKQEFKLNPETKKILNELTPAKRYSFLVESNSKNITVKQRLNSLLESSNVLVSDIEKAFSVEKVSKDFFDKYVKLYKKLVEAFADDKVFLKIISESNNGDKNFKENFVKKLLGQIVFLYFLQKKGWLGVPKDGKWGEGNKSFMQDLLAECLSGGDDNKELGGKNFFNDYLEHLFYANLNQKRENDYSEYFNCRIPYLNGGLFEPINNYHWKGFEYVVLSGDKNNALFKEIFDTFDEYNFTVYENDPLEQDVAVDPEMLGKVFENLLPENERKGKGAFYTPREIVHYMCKESLKNHIINKTGITEELCEKLFTYKDSYLNATKRGNKLLDEDKYNIFETFYEYGENIVETLKYVKIVDPAVGSGAFPMGLLKEIISLRKFIQENVLLQENVSEYELKKETLENCIYGVDLDPGAVEIAKLRFWLSLVIEEDSKDNIDPLPNLDYKIMQGNSLIEDIVVGDSVIKLDIEASYEKLSKKEQTKQDKLFGNIDQMSLSVTKGEQKISELLLELKYLHKKFFKERDNIEKKKLKEKIDNIEKSLIFESSEEEVNKLQQQIDSIEGKYIISGMAWDEKDAKKVALLYSQISSIKEMEEKYKRDNIRSFFPWKLHFGEVFNENGGFDIVIGNPPYVRHEEIKDFKEILRNSNYITYNNSADLYIYFFEKGYNILKFNGILSFITSSKYTKVKYAKEFREFILSNSKFISYIDFNIQNVFESATVDTAVLLFKKENAKSNNYFVYCDINKSYNKNLELENFIINNKINFNQNNLNKDIFSFISKEFFDINNKIKTKGIELKKLNVKINYGIKTGFNDAFIIDTEKKDELIKKDIKNKDIIEPILRGRDIKKYTYKFSGKWIINTHNNPPVNVENYPYIKEHLDLYYDKLEKRTDKGLTPYNLRNCAYLDDFKKEKIIWIELCDEAKFAYDNENFGLAGTWIMTGENLKFILGILNSKSSLFYFDKIATSSGVGTNMWKKYKIEQLPIPNLSIEEQKPFIVLVDQILEITKKEDYLEREDLQKQVKVLESRIDDMVYKLYELTPEEIELIKESLK